MTMNQKKKQDKEKALNSISWILNSKKLDGATAFHIFMALFRSKISYASNLISIFDKHSLTWYGSFLYRAIKRLLNIKDKVSKEELLRITLGKSFEEYMLIEQQNTISLIINYAIREDDQERIHNVLDFCEKNNLNPPSKQDNGFYCQEKQILPLKEIMKAGIKHHLKWRLNASFNLMARMHMDKRCPCDKETRINQSHITSCQYWNRIFDNLALNENIPRSILLQKLLNDPLTDNANDFKRIAEKANHAIKEELMTIFQPNQPAQNIQEG